MSLLIDGVSNSSQVFVPIEKNIVSSSVSPPPSVISSNVTQNKASNSDAPSSSNHNGKFTLKKELNPDEQKRVEELKRIDSKVRAHEMAHLVAGGGLVRGGANFTYEIGPDGKQYAVAGEVKIDMSADPNDPEKTIQKMQQVRRAALAPADPSPQDRSVAQQASNIEAQMRAKQLQEKYKPKDRLSKYLNHQLFNNFTQNKLDPQFDFAFDSNSFATLKRKVNTLV